MAEKAKNRGLYIVSESVPPINVIKVTTSETMRLGSPDKIPRQPTVPPTMLSTNVGQKKKASSFQITSVTESVASKVSVDGGDDSADDLEDSRTEDISDNIDLSKMSLDLDPSSLSDDPHLPVPPPPVQSDGVFITNAIPSPIIPSAEGHYGIAIVSTEEEGGDNKRVGNTTVTAETVITFPVTSKSGEVTADLSQWQNRFKIVKIERTEPYKRGRWECMDFSDQPASQGEGIKVDGIQAHSSATLVNGSPTGRTDPSHEGVMNPQPGSVCHSVLPGNFTSSIQHPKPSPMSTPSLQGVAGKVALASPSNQMLTTSTPVTTPGLTGLVSQGLVQCGQAGTIPHSAGNQIAPVVSSIISGSIRVVQGGSPQSMNIASVNQSPVTFPKVAGTGAQVANAQSIVPVPGPQHSVNIPIRPLPAVSTSIATQTLVKNASCNTADFQPLPSPTVSLLPNKDFQATHLPQQAKVTVTQSSSIPNQSTALPTSNVAPVCLSSVTKPQSNQQASSPIQPPHISHPSSGNISLNVKTDASYSATGNNTAALVITGGSNLVKSPVVGQSIGQSTLPFNSLIKESEENTSADQAHLSLEVTLGEIYGGTGTDDPGSSVGVSDDTECASGSSTVAIDNKIEQAMDLVKSHLMFAVREEVEVLKERITELSDRINQLEHENSILRSHATQETLSQLCTAVSSKPPVSTGTSSNPATFDGRL